MTQSLTEQLSRLSLGRQVLFRNELIQLNQFALGCELVVSVMPAEGNDLLIELLESGFISALRFEAGLSLTFDGSEFILSQWIADANSWLDVSSELDSIVEQANTLRRFVQTRTNPIASKAPDLLEERRLRLQLHRSSTK
jgi:hypothetical protein